MKFRVYVDDKTREYDTLEDAVTFIKMMTSRMSINALLAAENRKEELRVKCIKCRDSIRMEMIDDSSN
jgi:hypothetical protein